MPRGDIFNSTLESVPAVTDPLETLGDKIEPQKVIAGRPVRSGPVRPSDLRRLTDGC